jgi:transposase-like protein
VRTEVGPVELKVPRDQAGTFSPQIVPKHARRVAGFDEAIISLYAKGLTTGEIAAHLGEVYGTTVSRELISKVTDKVVDELTNWQNRPLDRGRNPSVVANLHHGRFECLGTLRTRCRQNSRDAILN